MVISYLGRLHARWVVNRLLQTFYVKGKKVSNNVYIYILLPTPYRTDCADSECCRLKILFCPVKAEKIGAASDADDPIP